MAQQQQAVYNPYAQPGQQQQANPYGGNPLAQQQPQAKTFSIPTWLAWLIAIGFFAFAGWLIWYMYFS